MGSEYDSVPLGEVAAVRSGFAFKSSDWTSAGVPVVKIANVKDGTLVMDDCSFVAQNIAEQAREFALKAGDILIAMTGYIGDVARVRDRDLPAVLNQRVGRFSILDHKRLDQHFLFYLLRNTEVRKKIEGLGYGSAQPNVSPTLIHGVEVPLPPLPEQQAIACILGALDDKIELNRRMNRTLEEMARAIFKSWFVDFDPVRAKAAVRREHPDWTNAQVSRAACPKLKPEIATLFPDAFEDSELGEIPEGWKVGTVEEVCEFAYGKALKADQREPGTVPVMGSNGQVGVHNQALVKGPGIIIGRKGNPGIITWVNIDFFPIDTTFYVVPRRPEYPLTFLCYALENLNLARFGADSAVPGLNRQIAYGAQLIIPDTKVLESFDSLLTPIRDRQQANENQSRTLAALRDALLPKLISGEIRVKDAERFLEERGL
jgi:type I restriction enzyme S subunit